jgi:sodium-coupled neutral amino acid transporter 11
LVNHPVWINFFIHRAVYSGLPYAVSQAGLVTGLILLLVLCRVTDWTILLIVVNAKLSGRSSYVEILHHSFGPSGRAAVSFFQFAFAFGGMCAYGIIIGKTIFAGLMFAAQPV